MFLAWNRKSSNRPGLIVFFCVEDRLWLKTIRRYLSHTVCLVFFLGCQVLKHPDVGAALDDILNDPADVVMTLFLNSWVFCFLAFTSWIFFEVWKCCLKPRICCSAGYHRTCVMVLLTYGILTVTWQLLLLGFPFRSGISLSNQFQ